ncbi:hypothetical protein QYF61_019260 [Mycteria americana]|uniref:Uncharacterized protein n=1 Tax=Mycteria americana TaxID=33587 RepID=A0AAN7MS80_MYCAM|nr:hypothetical protein QYF61_019260 [Mycteria americana]
MKSSMPCCIVGRHWKWKAALWGPTQQAAETAEGKDAHIPKSRATEERRSKELVNQATRIEVSQVDLDWEHKGHKFSCAFEILSPIPPGAGRYPQREEKVSGSGNKATGTVATPAPPCERHRSHSSPACNIHHGYSSPTGTGTAATPTALAPDTVVEPGNQPMLVSVAPIHKKKSWKRKSARVEREDEKGGPSQGEEEKELVDKMETT